MSDSPMPRILVVDDEVRHMTALCNILRENGYEPTGCGSGAAALATLKEAKFEVMLSDLMMPEMDGITLFTAAREIDPDLIGIIMTGHGTIDTAVEAMKTGALDYILKPFKLSAILAVLARALTVHRLRAENAVLERRVRERTVQLEESNRELESFACSVAHDLQAPTRHISGYAQMIIEDGFDEEAQSRLQMIVRAADRMSQMVNDLLAFSRLARSEMMARPVDLDRLVAEVRRDLQAETLGREIAWNISPLPTVQADRSMLQQVWCNLLANAVKYTRGRSTARIEITCREEAGEVIFSVCDNGAGFDMRYAEKLFTIFQRLHRQDEFEGTGVGLSLVQRILQRHGGRIWAEAELNVGARFHFSLPAPAASALK